MLYIFSLVNTIQLDRNTLSAGENPNGFQFGLLSQYLGLESSFDGSLEPVLQFQGRTWGLREETSSFTSVTADTDFSSFLNGAFDALIGGEAELQELAGLLGPNREATLATNPQFADMLIYEVNASAGTLRLTDLPTDAVSGTATAGNDVINGGIGDDFLNGLGGNDTISGGSGNDVIFGGAGTDELRGDGGNDVLIGGTGLDAAGQDDVARYTGTAAQYNVTGGSDYAVVTGVDGSRDKLFGISALRFDDGLVNLPSGSALDADAPFETLNKTNFVTAERVALLYEAALNRDGNIDLPGLNFYIDVTIRDGLSDAFLAQDLMTSPEFTASFGDANTLSNADFLEQIYLNVLDRASDAAGRQFYLDLLDDGTISKAEALADIAVSPENTAESVDVLRGLYEETTGEWAFL